VRNWKALAKGLGLDAAAADRIAAPLDALESEFRPLTAGLTPDLEPATGFRAEENE
jgi:hypothetical protein